MVSISMERCLLSPIYHSHAGKIKKSPGCNDGLTGMLIHGTHRGYRQFYRKVKELQVLKGSNKVGDNDDGGQGAGGVCNS